MYNRVYNRVYYFDQKRYDCSLVNHWFQVEVGRTPSVQCHNEKVADVCSTEYKDTTVGAVFSPTHNVSLEKVKRCKPVERLESQRVCQKVPHRVCRQVMSKNIHFMQYAAAENTLHCVAGEVSTHHRM